MRRLIVLSALLACLLAMPARGAVRGTEARYVGGTVSEVPQNTEGHFDLSGEAVAVFKAKTGQTISIPYQNIKSLEFGQKAGRRVGVALAVSPLFLFSKKRKHFLTVGFSDEKGQTQGAVFELAKGTVRPTLSTFETRSGKKVEYESEEAKKHAGN